MIYISHICLIFIWLSITFIGCQNKPQNDSINTSIISPDECDCEITSISVLYYNWIFNTARAKNWDDLKLNVPDFINNTNGVLDAEITDCNTLKKIAEELNTLEPAKDQSGNADIRILLTINYKDKDACTLTIGGYFAEGIFTKDRVELASNNTNRLLFLIKNNAGYYSWFDDEELNNMDELKDTSFVKKPLIESLYYKQYKETQNKVK